MTSLVWWTLRCGEKGPAERGGASGHQPAHLHSDWLSTMMLLRTELLGNRKRLFLKLLSITTRGQSDLMLLLLLLLSITTRGQPELQGAPCRHTKRRCTTPRWRLQANAPTAAPGNPES